MAVERPFAVRDDHHRDVGDVSLLCSSPYPYLHVLCRHYSLSVLVSAPFVNPENPDCSEQSDLDWLLGQMLPK